MTISAQGADIHYAITRDAGAGEYVLATTHVPWVVRQMMKAHAATEMQDAAEYSAATDEEREAWIFPPRMNVYLFEAGAEVWLGRPFDYRGATQFDGNFLQVYKGRRADGTPIIGECVGADEVRDIMSRAQSGNWLD